MGKLASKTTKRIMATLLTIAMIMSNMTVYASEYSEPAAQTEDAVDNAETGAVELPSTEDGTVQDDTAQDEGIQDEGTQDEAADDETSQEGTEGDAQDPDASDENSNPGNDEEGGDASEPEENGEEVQEPEETDADIQEAEDELESAEVSEAVETITPRAGEHTLWLVGDSTVCEFNDSYFYPRYGYGTQIGNYLDDTYTVRNLALSGRSSKSFLAESNYNTLKAGLGAGDVLVIGFAHNDEKAESERYTNPKGDYQTDGSFAKSLYDNYVKLATDAGAEVILCTPIVRRNAKGTLSNADCHITTDATDKTGKVYPGGDYPAAIRKLVQDAGGADKGVYLADLTELTKNLYNEIGADETLYLHAWTGGIDNNTGNPKTVDNTHLNIYGAKMVAWMFAKSLSGNTDSKAPAIKAHIKSNIDSLKPNKDTDLVKNPTYVKPKYDVPANGSAKYPTYTTEDGITFQPTFFGDSGGANKITSENFRFGQDDDGNMTISCSANGKIVASYDSAAMYYYRIPANQKFTFSAKAKLNSITSSSEVAFGLMARDDMYIDVYRKDIASDYVAAGSLGHGSNCFYRKDGELNAPAFTKESLTVGKEYELKITFNGDGYTCTFGNEDTQSGSFDYTLTSVDPDYAYIGMFVTREASVTFSDINLEFEDDGDYTITVSNDGNGTARASKTRADAGAEITLTSLPKSGYAFKKWEVLSGGVTITDNKFTMPAKDVEIKAVFEKLPVAIDVWDFGGKVETDSRYNNHITPEAIIASGVLAKGGTYNNGSAISYGDLKQINGNGDKLYSNITELAEYNTGDYGSAQYEYDDGYTAAGAYYCNGEGDSGKRCITIDVNAGDKIIAYMGSSQSGDITFHFEGQGGSASKQSDSDTVASGQFKKFEFTAEYKGTYKIWPKGSGKPMYHRIMRVPSAEVSGAIDFGDEYITGDYSVKFVNQTTGKEISATVEVDDTFTAKLAPGYTYKAVLVGVTGYGFTTASANLSITDDDVFNGKSDITLVAEYKAAATFSGTIRGFAADYDLDNLEIMMVPKDTSADSVKLQITNNEGKLTFTSELVQNMEYSFLLNGVNDYEVSSPLVINTEGGTSQENRIILVTTKPVYNVVGGFIGLADAADVTELKFTNLEDNYTYDADLADGGYSVDLRDGEYVANATVTGYTTNTHVVVAGGSVSKDLLFVSTAAKGDLAKKSDIYVGYPDEDDNYATVKEAVEACERMKPASETDRITVHIAPGTYREQIIIDTPYISFVNDTDEEVLLTWYYGIGYKYYSADSNGFYNPENAYDKFDKHIASKWGTTVYLKSKAQAFRAKGITFENSFNRYMTDEEIEDGVEFTGETIKVQRYQGLDVTSKAATERASVIVIDNAADKAEFLNCNFYSSQDTVMTGGAHTYFRNCVIEGQTDYICGKGNCVFDACELRWKGYSTGSQGGYLAVSQAESTQKGYLFRNCTVTANSKLDVKAGYWGRPWSADAGVVFMNTKLQDAGLIVAEGWTEMSGNKPNKDRLKEYNTTTIAGQTVDTSKRADFVMTAEAAAAIKISDYLGSDWTPEYYKAEDATVAISSEGVRVIDNADINTPKAGNTLTVIYSLGENDANDASIISWYAVEKENGVEKENSAVLLKASTATLGKNYKVDKGLVGKYIKVTVTPQTVSGKTGTAQSYILENAIADGYEDPSNPDGDISLGDGINIFLAGDSTVKDYSAAGMYNNGTPLNEGSWGEFIQTFFNESEVKIQNYAQGGRSSRTFINEGKLKAIEDNIGEGDYLFIQFGHNDSSDKYPDRYVPLGDPVDGKYPSTPGTPGSDGQYPDGGNGTFKWFLQQYIKVAKDKGAIPVLVTPVSRMYYNSDGTIYAHHDKETSSNKNNTYVTAMEELAKEQDVLLIDGFDVTKKLFEAAWKADGKNSAVYGTQIMSTGDKTHNNKLGGMIEAAAIASEIQKLGIDISYAVKTPTKVTGLTPDGKTVFSVDADSNITANDINSGYTERAAYWETVGNTMLSAVKSKAEQLGAETPAGAVSAPTATPAAGAVEKGTEVTLSVTGSAAGSVEIYYTTDGSSPKAKDNSATKLYSDGANIIINENTTIKAYAKEKVETGTTPTLTDSKVVTFVYTLLPSVKAPALKAPAETTVKAGTAIKLETDTENAQIRYTMGSNPADPTVNSPLYNDTKGIVITSATTIKAIAVKDGETSSVATFVFTIEAGGSTSVTVAAPTSNTADGAVELRKVIHLRTETENALIYFTKGTTPADPTKNNADLYDDSEGIVIDRSMKIKAIAVVGDSTSTVAAFEYTVPTTKEPESNKEVGEVEKGTEITLTSETGADIYYTTDRTDPRTSGTRVKYADPIVIDVTKTIRAYAVMDGKAPSDVVTLNYTIYREPVRFTTDPALTSSGGDKATPRLGDTLTVSYVLDKTDEDIDTSTINWYRIDGTEKESLSPDSNTARKSYTIRESDVGKIIKVEITPKIKGGKAGEMKSDETGKVLASASGTGKGLEIILSKEDYTYTGSAIIPEFTVTNNGETLTAGVDYTVKYSNNKNANSTKDKTKRAKITVTGKGSFSGKSVANFTINPKSLVKDDNDKNPVVAGGITVVKNKKVAPILVYNGIKLSAKDFTIEGDSKFPAAGNKTVKVKAKENGNFTGSRDIPVTVVESAKNLKKIAVTVKTKSYVFDGNPHYADIEVTSGGNKITNISADVEDKYAVTYSTGCIDAGTVKFTVIGMGEYTGTVTKSYKITPNKGATISVSLKGAGNASYEYVSTGVIVPDEDIIITTGGKPLTKDVDYKVTYSGNKKVTKGSAKAKANITFIGNYKGCPKKPLLFSITPATISKDTVTVFAADKIFKNKGIYKSVPSVIYEDADGAKTLLKKSDYDVKYYLDKDCTDAKEMKGGTKVETANTPVYVKVTGKGNYATPSDKPVAIGEYKVCELGTKQDLSKAKVEFGKKGTTADAFTKVNSIEYTGKAITFNNDDSDYVTKVTIGKGKNATVVSSDKYTVKYYANNINKGTATIVIVPTDAGSAEFIGGKTATFKIVAQKVPATFGTSTGAGKAAANALNVFKSAFN